MLSGHGHHDHPLSQGAGVLVASRVERAGCVIAVLQGELDIASAPALREELHPGASRLIIDLSAVGYADASGVAILVGIGHRAGLLGGWLRLAAPAPEVTRVLSVTGLGRHLVTFPTVSEAITGRHPDAGLVGAGTGISGRRARSRPVHTAVVRARCAAGGGQLGSAVSALLPL
jgi:anti-sigma B factor antagonist